MKIEFLGTSAGWPLPRLGCKCAICSSKDPKDARTRTQLLISDQILLDAGPDTYARLKTHNLTKIKAIFISHEHPDHIMGLWDITHVYNLADKIDLYVTRDVLSGINKIIRTHGRNLNIKVVKPFETVNIGDYKISYFPIIHGNTPAYGIKVKEKRIVAYIPDFAKILPSSQKIIKGCDFLVIDGSSLGKIGQGPGHISIQDGILIAKRLKAKNVYFVHIGHKTGTHVFLEKYLKENAGPNFHVAYDGQEIEI